MTTITKLTKAEYIAWNVSGAESRIAQARDPEYQPPIPPEGEEREAWLDGWRGAEALATAAGKLQAMLNERLAERGKAVAR